MGRHKSTSKHGPGKGHSGSKKEEEEESQSEQSEFEWPAKLLQPSSVCINPTTTKDEPASAATDAAAASSSSAAAASSSSAAAAAAAPAASADPPLYLPSEIAGSLKPHQIEGIRFCWRAVVGPDLAAARSQPPEQGNGCLLAHFCGLGKTVQVISFLYMYLNSGLGRCALVVAPVNTLSNWIAEFEKWLKPRNRLDVWCLDSCSAYAGKKVQAVRYKCLKAWAKQGGVLIAGYEGFRQIWQAGAPAAATKSGASKQKQQQKHAKKGDAEKARKLLLHSADICVADEAHRVKSASSTLSKAIKELRTHRRIALTGTPLQNNVGEYYTMVDFIRPGFLGSLEEFRHRFDAPIRAGMCSDSAPEEVRLMQKRIHVLVKKLQPLLHRVDYAMLKAGTVKGIEFVADATAAAAAADEAAIDGSEEHDVSKLPGKSEYVLFAKLTPFQRALYERFIATHHMTLFRAYHSLMKLTNHPSCLESTNAILDADSDVSDEEAESKGGKKGGKAAKANAAQSAAAEGAGGAAWYGSLLDASSGYRSGRVEDSGKLVLCMFLVASALHAREKVLIFTQSLDLLDLLENVLQSYFDLRPKEGYFRLDGSTSSSARHEHLEQFNDQDSPARVFLISTRAGCLGVNATGASRVIIFDASWNPSNDTQAIYRAYRFGQRKHVSVYRLISAGGLEEKIYRRQLMKNGLSLRVVDKHEVDRLFSREGVEALWSLEPANEAEEDRVALAALAQVQKAAGGGLQISHAANGRVVLEMEDSDDEGEKAKASAAASSSAAAAAASTAATATSSTHQILDPSRPITDPLLCHVLSLLGPKRLRPHFAAMVLQAQKQKALAAQLRKQAQEQGELDLVARAAAANGKSTKSEAAKSASKAEAEQEEESSTSSESEDEDLTPAQRRKLRAANKAALAAALAASPKESSAASAKSESKKLQSKQQQASSDEEATEERKGRDDDSESMSDVEITGTKAAGSSKKAAATKQEEKSNATAAPAAASAAASVKRGRGRPRKLPVRSSGKPDIEEDSEEEKASAPAAAAAASQGLKSKPVPVSSASDDDDAESEEEDDSVSAKKKPAAAAAKSNAKPKPKGKSSKHSESSDESFGEDSDEALAEESAESASGSDDDEDDDDDESDAPTSSEEEGFVVGSSDESASDSDDSDDSGYGSDRRKKKKRGGKGGKRGRQSKKVEGTRGVKKAHFLLDLDLPTDTPAAKQIMDYISAMMAEDEEAEEEEEEERKSSIEPSSSDAIPPAALKAAQSLSICDSSWVACIQQPDALLIDMPELKLTAQEAEAAEAEFTHALANEPSFSMGASSGRQQRDGRLAVAQATAMIQQQQLAAYAFMQTVQQLVFPPPTAQLLMPAAYMAIKNSYFEQLSRDHSDFLQRVYSDVLRGDNASQAHLQAHFASFVEGAVKTMGPEAWNVEAVQAAAMAATAEASEAAAASGAGAGFAPAAAAGASSAPAKKRVRTPLSVRGKGSSKAMAIDLSDEDDDEQSDEEDESYAPNRAKAAKAKKQRMAHNATSRAAIPATAAAAARPAPRAAPAAPQPPPQVIDDDDDLPPLLPM